MGWTPVFGKPNPLVSEDPRHVYGSQLAAGVRVRLQTVSYLPFSAFDI
jgi:hypothetical protein